MSLIEQATQRLEALRRAGVTVPWAAAGLAHSELQRRVDEGQAALPAVVASPPQGMAAALPVPLVPHRSVTLDLARLERSGHLVPTQTRTALAEQFRQMKRPLLRRARSPGATAHRLALIMVTSALPGEGKTFCAINLAMSMAAEIDTSVLLVDADVVRPEVLQRLGITASLGLMDLLTQPGLSLSEVVLGTNVPKLSILPAGTGSVVATELLASASMDRLLEFLAGSDANRVVIMDGPPLLVTSEAAVLAARVGQVVLVVESAKTPRSAVADAFALVEACPNVVSVLNKAEDSGTALAYGYGYG